MKFSKSCVYQIYPKSFMDANGDGIGDIRGIIEKLDYIRSLGVDYIWSTPFFVSPLNDNGYDVENYREIDPAFGTMADVEELISEAEKRGIGLMFDMVFNHTSTKHSWFQRALQGEKEYQDYYIFRDGTPDQIPTNWESKFGGPAWEYVPSLGKWYLHLFDVTQADLNWENPKVREELKDILRFWKKKGVKGFRFDVVNLISKPDRFEDDTEGDGRRFYTDGPRVHAYLQELIGDAEVGDMITVGEMSSTTLDNCVRYAGAEEGELSMVFSFHHLKIDYRNGQKWALKAPDLGELKSLLTTWQLGMQEKDAWNAVFWCNHDQPRIVSRLGDEGKYWKPSAKMLATAIHLLRGTPYIYQGEELGMCNAGFTDIAQYRDVESTNYYEILLREGKRREEALQILGARSRDNGRTPMAWSDTDNAGFSKAEPWIEAPTRYHEINAEAEEKDPDSILHYYRKLVQLRKELPVISEGRIAFRDLGESVFSYEREWQGERLLVLCNLTGEACALTEEISTEGYEKLLGNYSEALPKTLTSLAPFETVVLYQHERGGDTAF